MGKIYRIKVNTPNGFRYVAYKEVTVDPKTNTLICEKCAYNKICTKIPDPTEPDNQDRRYSDFCSELGIKDSTQCNIGVMIPVEGELEELFKDSSGIMQNLIKNDPIIHMSDIISDFCSGWCDSYRPDHKNCNDTNSSCILRELFLKSKKYDNK